MSTTNTPPNSNDGGSSKGKSSSSQNSASNDPPHNLQGQDNLQAQNSIDQPKAPDTQNSPNYSVVSPSQDSSSVDPKEAITTTHTPLKYGGKKVIATIFSIIFLVAAVTIGVYLVQQQQRLQQMAASGRECEQSPDCILLDNPGNQGSFEAPRTISYVLITDQDVHRYDRGENDDGCRKVSISGNYLSWDKYGSGSSCKDISNIQVWLGEPEPSNTPTPTQIPTATPTTPPEVTPSIAPSSTPSPSPTLPPEITARCSDVKAYDLNWNQLSKSDLSTLSSGDKVRFSVLGNSSSGTFDKARFEVNGNGIGETTTKKPGSEEFYIEYTIPTNTIDFEVKGEIYHSSLGWI